MKTFDKKVVYRSHFDGQLVEIIDRGDERSLYFGGHVLQSTIRLSRPESLALIYTRFMMAPLLFNETPERILIIGLGAGSLLHFLHHQLPDCHIDTIDNSPDIIDLARKFFMLPEDSRVVVHHGDGYGFLADLPISENSYDLILLDAFDAQGMAASIYRSDFFDLCRSHLNQAGMICLNMWSGDRNRMAEVKEDIREIFQDSAAIPVPKRGNVICIGWKNGDIWQTLRRKSLQSDRLQAKFGIDFDAIIRSFMKHNLNFTQRISHYLKTSRGSFQA
jgi:spermidine synthase